MRSPVSFDDRPRALGAAIVVAIGLVSSLAPAPAVAGWATDRALSQNEGERDWRVDLAPYLWSIGITGRLGAVDPALTSVATSSGIIEFPSATDSLNAAFMAALEVRWRRWALFVDGSWVELADEQLLLPLLLSGRWQISLAQGTVAATYELPFDIGPAFDVMIGSRWWRLGTGLQLVPLPPGTPIGAADSVAFADFVVGVRVREQIAEHWNVWARADVGGGEARLDWSLEAGVGWDFGRHVGLLAAYRVVGVDYEAAGFLYDITHAGLLVGLRVGY